MARARPRVDLVDGSVYIFRAYHALPPMQAPDGRPTNAAYGFANTLLRYLAEHDPTHLAVAFDHSMQSFRTRLFPAYKAQRGETPEDLSPQFDLCEQVTRALGIPLFSQPDYEADDLIATLASRAAARGSEVRIVSSDKDLTQLVREDGRVALYDLAQGEHLGADAVRAKFGVDPAQIPDYLGLVGDAVDNLPGVPGVGPKGAAAALRSFGRIEDVPADPSCWSGVAVRGVPRLAALIDAHRAQALHCRELATVVRDAPGCPQGLGPLRYRGALRRETEALFESLGWERILERVSRWAPGS